jgi:hypothetical protein
MSYLSLKWLINCPDIESKRYPCLNSASDLNKSHLEASQEIGMIAQRMFAKKATKKRKCLR